MKPEWEFQCHWSFSTPLCITAPSWKHYSLDQFHSEHIIAIRMFADRLQYPTPLEFLFQENKEKLGPYNVVWHDNSSVDVSA